MPAFASISWKSVDISKSGSQKIVDLGSKLVSKHRHFRQSRRALGWTVDEHLRAAPDCVDGKILQDGHALAHHCEFAWPRPSNFFLGRADEAIE
jgi:hypothetical protein